MATNQARENNSGYVDFTLGLSIALNQLKKALDEIHQFIIFFESRNRKIRKGEFKGEDMLQHHLESWRIVHNDLNLDDRLNAAGVPILEQLRVVCEFLLKDNIQPASAMDILTSILSCEMPRLQTFFCELPAKVLDSVSAFEHDQKYFNMLIEMHNFQLSLDQKEIESIGPRKAAIILELTSETNEIMSNCELFNNLVDREIKLHSEIAKRNKIKVILSDVTHKLTFLLTSMSELVTTICEKVYPQTLEQCDGFETIKGLINGGKIEEAQTLLANAILEWKIITPRKDFLGEEQNN